ncbi:MAG: hypothetical protein ACFB5Z_21080 [Elainellaceae cyanobacterium]
MFTYADPTGTDILESQRALIDYRAIIDGFYRNAAQVPNSGFALLDAFETLLEGASQVDSIPWRAFPVTASAPFEEIDSDRFRWQDEYVEWRTERSESGEIARITFTTEFPEYYQALARVGVDALVAGIQDAIPEAHPTLEEMFGNEVDPRQLNGEGRAQRFRLNLSRNPWNNGEKGILCLTQQFNTVGALFNLVDKCAVQQAGIPASAVCSAVGGACGSGRNSDPVICQASQNMARADRAISLLDPVGVKIKALLGSWDLDDVAIDINDEATSKGAWTISRNGRRAVLDLTKGSIAAGGSVITSGAQVANELQVEADVISAPDSGLPTWARMGREFMRAS